MVLSSSPASLRSPKRVKKVRPLSNFDVIEDAIAAPTRATPPSANPIRDPRRKWMVLQITLVSVGLLISSVCIILLIKKRITSGNQYNDDSYDHSFTFTPTPAAEIRYVQEALRDYPPFSNEEKKRLHDELLDGVPEVRQPTFFLTIGSPGAKKISILDKVLEEEGLPQKDVMILNAGDAVVRTKAMQKILSLRQPLPFDLVESSFRMQSREFVRKYMMDSVVFPKMGNALHHVVIDSTCSDSEYCSDLLQRASVSGYTRALLLAVNVSVDCAVRRIMRQAVKSGRYVPLSVLATQVPKIASSTPILEQALHNHFASARVVRANTTTSDCVTSECGVLLVDAHGQPLHAYDSTPIKSEELPEDCALRAVQVVNDLSSFASDRPIVDPWGPAVFFLAQRGWKPKQPNVKLHLQGMPEWYLAHDTNQARAEWTRARGLARECPSRPVGDDFLDLEVLSGSTFPVKTRYLKDDSVWVRKQSKGADMHIFNEFLTNQLYALGGAIAPSCCYYGALLRPADRGPQDQEQMLCKWIDGLQYTRDDRLAIEAIGDAFVLNALLGNFDITDQNVMWEGKGPIFLDNGAGLAKLAEGQWKDVEYNVTSDEFQKRPGAWTREPWALWDFRQPQGRGGFRDLDKAFRNVTAVQARTQVQHIATLKVQMLRTFPKEYSDVRQVFADRIECTILLANDQRWESFWNETHPADFVKEVCADLIGKELVGRKQIPPQPAPKDLNFSLSGDLAKPLPNASCYLPSWVDGVRTIPQEPHTAEDAFVEMIECAKNLSRPLGITAWRPPKVQSALSEITPPISAVFNTWNLSTIKAEHPICAPCFTSEDLNGEMAPFQVYTEQRIKLMPVQEGAFGARLFRADSSCALHAKLWVVKDTVAAVVTYNADENSPHIDFGVLVFDVDLVRSLYELHRWDFECNSIHKGWACSRRGPPELHPAILPGFSFTQELPNMRARYESLIMGARGKITVVSPTFTEPSVADWVKRACLYNNIWVDVFTTWRDSGDKGLLNDYLVAKVGKEPRARILNLQEPHDLHGNLVLFHDKVELPASDPLSAYMEKCEHPFLLTSAKIYPGMWRTRELGVILCSGKQWDVLHQKIWTEREKADEGLRANFSNATEAFAALQSESQSKKRMADLDGDGFPSWEELEVIWHGIQKQRWHGSRLAEPPVPSRLPP